MLFRSSLVLFLVSLAACGRPPLAESTLTVSVLRRDAQLNSVYVSLEDEEFPCGRLDATVTLNGVLLNQTSDGTRDRGSHLFIPLPGCQPPTFELELKTDEALRGPFELVLDAGGERVMVRSEELLTLGYAGNAQVQAGAGFRLLPIGTFKGFGLRQLDLSGPAIERQPDEDSEAASQRFQWEGWDTAFDGEDLVATVPADMPAGTYAWRAQFLTIQVPVQQFEGVRICDVRLGLDVSGVVTVTR